MFGALLGTLAQSSSSTAQKRRVDIEKKQQEKLKLQAEEHDEKKKQRLNALMETRRQEQKKYDKQSVTSHIIMSNNSRLIGIVDADSPFKSLSHRSFPTHESRTKASRLSSVLGNEASTNYCDSTTSHMIFSPRRKPKSILRL